MLQPILLRSHLYVLFFFFLDPAPTDIYTLSLHDALPISPRVSRSNSRRSKGSPTSSPGAGRFSPSRRDRSEEHTSELQSRFDLVCRLLLEKKNKKQDKVYIHI